MRKAPILLLLLALLATLLLAGPGCRGRAGEPPAGAGRRYPLTGTVRSVDLAEGQARVAHEAIPDFMDAMTMPFSVRPRETLERLAAGDTIRATLVVSEGRSWLEGVTVTAKGSPGMAADPAGKAPPRPPASPGDEVPAFSLVDQSGRPVTRETFRGRHLVVTFFFTRCPLPEYCPRMSESFGKLEKALAADPGLAARTRLLSVSFDPGRDGPEVLASYGLRFHDAASGPPFVLWTLASGPEAEVRKLGDFLGLWVQKDGDGFSHNLVTTVVDGEGRVVRSFFGNAWKPDDVLAELRKLPLGRR